MVALYQSNKKILVPSPPKLVCRSVTTCWSATPYARLMELMLSMQPRESLGWLLKTVNCAGLQPCGGELPRKKRRPPES